MGTACRVGGRLNSLLPILAVPATAGVVEVPVASVVPVAVVAVPLGAQEPAVGPTWGSPCDGDKAEPPHRASEGPPGLAFFRFPTPATSP